MDFAKTNAYVDAHFEDMFVEPLSRFIEIPNLSPDYDQEFFTNGLIHQAIDQVVDFADSLKIPGLEHHLCNEEGKAPMLFFVYPGNGKRNIMLYGHLDKQPHMDGWNLGTGPTTPVIIGDKLYGRGSSDDGYVPFFFLLAVKNALEQGQELPRLCLVLETEEESGSHDLVYLIGKNAEIIGKPDVCICCDSGCLNYDSIWLTSTLRGVLNFNLTVETATQGSHSGLGGGILPDTWRIITMLIARLENP
jgi:acetylornithine deacetylase/succinyl-diaminopimelate desuccinylase-like protein